MKNILIVGYYYRNNLGDDLFIETIPNFFTNSSLKFVTADDIRSCNLREYDGIIFGGGDLVNDYFLSKVKYTRDNFNGPIYAFSLGIPYYETISKGYLNHYDHVFTRNKSFLVPLQHALGSTYAHYIPDAVTTFGKDLEYIWESSNNTVGIFLPSTLQNPLILMKLCSSLKIILDKYPEINLHMYCFDTKYGNSHDLHINTKVFNTLTKYKHRIVNDTRRYTGKEMLKNISSLKMAICSRFHSHILSIITGTPFVSFHYTNKVSLLMKEKGIKDYECNIEINDEARPVNFNEESFLSIFDDVIYNTKSIHTKLIEIRDHDRMLCEDQYQIERLLHSGSRRTMKPDPMFMNNVDLITNKFRVVLEKNDNDLTEEVATTVSKSMLYEITNEISNAGVDGTIGNLIEKPHMIREMVDWVWKNKANKCNGIPSFNLKTSCIQSFCGIHRSGWKFALDSIQSLHSDYGIIFDVYCDATFGWCKNYPCREYGMIPYTSPWCGFFHHTPNEDYSNNNIVRSTESLEFKQSLEVCLGLFVMSEWLAVWLRKRLSTLGFPDIPVVSVIHPTVTYGIVPFYPLKNTEKIKIVNVGSWLRNAYSIYRINLDPKIFEKYRLKGKDMDNYFPPDDISFSLDMISTIKHDNSFLYCMYKYIRELQAKYGDNIPGLRDFIDKQMSSVKILDHLPNKEFDLLMSEYVVFVDFIECSAANTLVECMARGNPIIVNRFPAVVEYLGPNYPLYFDSPDDVHRILTRERIEEARMYMSSPGIKTMISSEKFFHDIYSSVIAESSKLSSHLN